MSRTICDVRTHKLTIRCKCSVAFAKLAGVRDKTARESQVVVGSERQRRVGDESSRDSGFRTASLSANMNILGLIDTVYVSSHKAPP